MYPSQLVGDLVMGYTTEIVTVILVISASFLLTMPKAQYVKRKDRMPGAVNGEHAQLEAVESPPLNKMEHGPAPS